MPLCIEPRTSKGLAILYSGVYLGAVVILLFMPISVWLKFLGCLFCLADFIRILRLYVLRISGKAIVRITSTPAGEWVLQQRQGTEISAKLLGDSFISTYLIILNFRHLSARRRFSVLITRDNVNPDCFRQLSVHLRIGHEKSPV